MAFQKANIKELLDKEVNFKDNYFTYKRTLKLEEYDSNGNLIDVIEFEPHELDMFCKHMAYYKCNGFKVARKEDREYFKGEKLKLAKKILFNLQCEIFDDGIRELINNIFNLYTEEQINFALNFKDYFYNESIYRFSISDYHYISKKNFINILDWIKESKGFWYAIDDNGKKGMAYLNQPTKKQALYQKNKNKMKIVFLNFQDMKEYAVDEDVL